jgi:hypothetical protein
LKREEIEQFIESYVEASEILLADDFDDAFIGTAERFGMQAVAAYDEQKCIEILMSQGMDEEEAREYFEYNTLGAWVGEGTPIFINLYRS